MDHTRFLSKIIAHGGILAQIATPIWRRATGAPRWVSPGATLEFDFVKGRYFGADPHDLLKLGRIVPGKGLYVGDASIYPAASDNLNHAGQG